MGHIASLATMDDCGGIFVDRFLYRADEDRHERVARRSVSSNGVIEFGGPRAAVFLFSRRRARNARASAIEITPRRHGDPPRNITPWLHTPHFVFAIASKPITTAPE